MQPCRWRTDHEDKATCASAKIIGGHRPFDPQKFCTVCPFIDHAPLPHGQAQAPRRGPCVHLGDEVRRVECSTCSGRIQLKVFTCAVHGECTNAKRGDGVAGCCVGCADYRRG